MRNIPYSFILRRLATILSVAIISLSLIAAITGILLSFYYEPTAIALSWTAEITNTAY